MRLTIPRKINIIKAYSFLLWITVFIGAYILSLNVGFKLSLYRILLLFSPFLFFFAMKNYGGTLKKSVNFIYFQFLIVWIVYSIFCLIFVIDYSTWANYFLFLLCGTISSWFIGMSFSSKEDFTLLFKWLEIFTFFIILHGLYESLTGNYYFVTDALDLEALSYSNVFNKIVNVKQPMSILGNPNNYAFFVVFSFFISLAMVKLKRSIRGKCFSMLTCIMIIYLIIATQSRSGLLGLSAGLLTMFVIYFWNSSLNKKIKIFFVCVFCLSLFYGWVSFQDNISLKLVEFNTEQQGGSDNIRINLVKNGFVILKNTYFLGTGLGNIEHHMSQQPGTHGITNMHNWWLEILVSSGVIIFFLYVFIYLRNILLLYRASSVKDKKMAFVSKCMLGFSIAFIIACMGPSSCMIVEWMWPCIAMCMAFTNVLIQKNNRYIK